MKTKEDIQNEIARLEDRIQVAKEFQTKFSGDLVNDKLTNAEIQCINSAINALNWVLEPFNIY